ncbi:hypothetical protein HHK36_015130 [Tetracentron sinense]|uniref:DNL-type domain-containing protein n=1 Tax=Tetracentron sinense TaxID=13715 RepID=A0A834Z4A9_TETSI|nr:hypothetical protein HHK36_015130 [Tetracentron sinense]
MYVDYNYVTDIGLKVAPGGMESTSSSTQTVYLPPSNRILLSLLCFSPSIYRFSNKFSIFDSDNENEADLRFDSNAANVVPLLNNSVSLSPLSKDAAMGLVLSAATGRGWMTGSGMEGPSVPAGVKESGMARISTFPWSLFTKSTRRRMRVAFTCNVCGQRTTRAINPHAYTDGTVFVQVLIIDQRATLSSQTVSPIPIYLFIIFEGRLQAIPFLPRNCLEQNMSGNKSVNERIQQRIEPWIRRELQAVLGDSDPSVTIHLATSLWILSLKKSLMLKISLSDH